MNQLLSAIRGLSRESRKDLAQARREILGALRHFDQGSGVSHGEERVSGPSAYVESTDWIRDGEAKKYMEAVFRLGIVRVKVCWLGGHLQLVGASWIEKTGKMGELVEEDDLYDIFPELRDYPFEQPYKWFSMMILAETDHPIWCTRCLQSKKYCAHARKDR